LLALLIFTSKRCKRSNDVDLVSKVLSEGEEVGQTVR
jgi:hypothetical protein